MKLRDRFNLIALMTKRRIVGERVAAQTIAPKPLPIISRPTHILVDKRAKERVISIS